MSRRGWWRGGDLALDFCGSFLATPWRRFLRRRREEGDGYAGAVAAGLLRLAAGWRIRRTVLVVWPDGGRSCAASRRRRPELPDLEVEFEPGDVPRPARHSDMWAFLLLMVVHKALGRWGSFDLWYAGRLPSSSSGVGVDDGRRCRPDLVANPRVLFVFSGFFWGFLAKCMVLRILLDRIPRVCTFAVPHMSTT